MLLSLLLLAAGLVLLVASAGWLVVGAARIAVALRISAVVIGALLIGFGTSAPELVASTTAAARGFIDLSAGNIAGSNIANITLVLGIAALVFPLRIQSATLRTEAPLAVAATALFALLVQGGLTRPEGAVLLAAMAAAVWWIILRGRDADVALLEEVKELTEADDPFSLPAEAGRVVAGLAGTIAGAQLLVEGAQRLAEHFGIGEGFIGLTLVALGTSAPELVTAVQAARRREGDLIIGNLLGSNMTNALAVGGAAALAGPAAITDAGMTVRAMAMMAGVSLAAWLFMATGRRVQRWEAAVLVAMYLVALPLLPR